MPRKLPKPPTIAALALASMSTTDLLTPREIWRRMKISTPGTVKVECAKMAKRNEVERVMRDGRSYYRRPMSPHPST